MDDLWSGILFAVSVGVATFIIVWSILFLAIRYGAS